MEIPTAAQNLIMVKLREDQLDILPADERSVRIIGHATIKIRNHAAGASLAPGIHIKPENDDDGEAEWEEWIVSDSEWQAFAKIVADANRQWKAGQ